MSIGALDGFGLDDWLRSEEAGVLQRHFEERIMHMLFSQDPESSDFQRMAAQLAWLGTPPADKWLIEREIVQLNLSDSLIRQCGFLKEVGKACSFVWNYKVEIVVGTAIAATGIGIAYVAGYAVSAAVGGVVVAGAGSIFSSEEQPNPHIPHIHPPSSKDELAVYGQPLPLVLPKLELPASTTEILVTVDGVWAGDQFFSNEALKQHSHFAEYFEKMALPSVSEASVQPNVPEPIAKKAMEGVLGCVVFDPPTKAISQKFVVQGARDHGSHIGWINGIDNTFDESIESATYIQSLAEGHKISGIYNRTHTPPVDIVEAAILNHSGFSPVTGKLLKSEWIAFHEANLDQPNAKLLQVCHSQGTIHVKNTLEELPQEIRDRIIVIAISPAAIVPRGLCFQSHNYASENDFVYKLEPGPHRPLVAGIIDDVMVPRFGDPIYDSRDELILLKPHEGATGIDHGFQSPTFRPVLQNRLDDYKQHGGEYLPNEKGNKSLGVQ